MSQILAKQQKKQIAKNNVFFDLAFYSTFYVNGNLNCVGWNIFRQYNYCNFFFFALWCAALLVEIILKHGADGSRFNSVRCPIPNPHGSELERNRSALRLYQGRLINKRNQ